MRLTTKMTSIMLAVTALGITGFASEASADVYLDVQRYTQDAGSTPMWGFARCDDTGFTNCAVLSTTPGAAGPQIDAITDDTLIVHVRNNLEIPVSFTIPGQTGEQGRTPVMMAEDPNRVQSFTHEAGANGGTDTYTFNNLAEGTYLYQSGTFPSLQVPMGLYGALVVSDGTGTNAYGHAISSETVLLFSEIDPVQNGRVDAAALAAGTSGAVPKLKCDQGIADYPCAVDYNPMYFLVNGGATADLVDPTPLDSSAEDVLIRFLNAGLRSHTPSIVGVELDLIAEDGNAYPGLPLKQNAALLAAGKTLDAIARLPGGNQTYSLFDRMPTFSNESLPNGGSLVNMDVGTGTAAGPAPGLLALDDVYPVDEDTLKNVVAADGVLDNDDASLDGATMVSGVSHGTIECTKTGEELKPGICADGSFTYSPNDDYSGSDSFAYSATSTADGNDYGATVMLNVSFENDDPVAAADSYTNNIGTTISVPAPGVLGNDADADGDALTVTASDAVTGLTLNADGSFEFDFLDGTLQGTEIVFSYTAFDGTASSVADVTLNFNEVPGLSLVVKEPGVDGALVPAYRWTVEEDTTFHPDPADTEAESLATTFHSSYMPVVAQGCVGEGACSCEVYVDDVCTVYEATTPFGELALDPNKHYYVSVLPADAVSEENRQDPDTLVFLPYRMGHTIGGASIPTEAKRAGNNQITVITNSQPLPYAQISIIVFEDNSPTNGGIDAGEQGLGGFQITLEDAGGRYGASAGQMSQNADGEPLTNSLDCFDNNPNDGVANNTPAGVILSCPDTITNQENGLVGRVLIKNLFPAKYGIITTAPQNGVSTLGEPVKWVQTSTIEGTKVIDAWVKAGEPPFFSEFGPAGVHAFVGFVSPERIRAFVADAGLGGGGSGSTISGAVTNYHMSRPPNQQLVDSDAYNALAHTRPWVGLNTIGGVGPNIVAQQATITEDDNGKVTATFQFDDVPAGNHQVVVWDSYLDQVIAYSSVSNEDPLTGAAVDVTAGNENGNIPVFNWFARLENHVFLDDDEDGIRDLNEAAIPEQAVTLRWRDGTLYQSFPTDLEGFVPFDQVFPFFNWLVAEVDYARFKATGLTVKVDHGGPVDNEFVLNPQIQADGELTRSEAGQVLTQGFQGFLGQTSVFEWGKKPYAAGENGGISGIVYYGVTRAEADPRRAAAEPWEPGIARVKVRLYREVNTAPDPLTGEPGPTALALVKETVTDSWDDSLPNECPGAHDNDHLIVGGPAGPVGKCYDGLRNFNQARPAVFDGGYAFNDIPPGVYVVEVVVPQGYELMKEEDVNVSYGDGYAAEFITAPGGAVIPGVPDAAMVEGATVDVGLAQPECVGELREVPRTLSLFPSANEEAPFKHSMRPLCDRKRVILSDQGQSAADFTLMTDAPIAAHYAGMVLDDVAQEFNPLSPQFGEKWAPPFVPVSIRDYKGEEISRVYSDQWGRINGLMPSTFTANMPSPSGFSPAMHMTCMNDPGPIMVDGELVVDPQFNPAYSNFCYNFQYMPGATTYLDTPVVPVASFASGYNPADCALDPGTPMIRQVNGTGVGPLVADGGTLTITSLGTAVTVPNPAYEGPPGLQAPGADPIAAEKTIQRDFGFGTQGAGSSVTIGGVPLTITSWTADTIIATVTDPTEIDPVIIETGQLVVTRDNGNSTEHAITVTVSTETPTYVVAGGSIQTAIDNAAAGDLILVEPGVYNESVIMWKPVRLQGAGAGSTIINAVKRPTEVLVAWRAKMDKLFADGSVDSLPNQADGAAGFTVSEGAAITVVGIFDTGKGKPPENSFSRGSAPARIDGFSVTGADVGGGILVNSNAHRLEIANNHVFANNGSYNGGVRIGQPFLELGAPDGDTYGFNTNVDIHHNAITQNGGLGGVGGGLSISTGSDNYTVSNNFVCGNFTTGNGGGIGHAGLSDGGSIANNRILLNQSFNQAVTVSGGGLFIGGEAVVVEFLERDNPTTLGIGTGNVDVTGNTIQSNQAGAGHGGGIRTQFVNGQDIVNNKQENKWYHVAISGNTIVNNVAGWSGGGISLQDTVRAEISRNTIAHNDSTATVGGLTDINPSAMQPAGISTARHSDALLAVLPGNNEPTFSDPDMPTSPGQANTIWENRSFSYEVTPGGVAQLIPGLAQTAIGECPVDAMFWDLDPLLGQAAPVATSAPDPFAGSSFCNGGRSLTGAPGPMFALPALDEGGNAWIDVRFGPLTRDPAWSYTTP